MGFLGTGFFGTGHDAHEYSSIQFDPGELSMEREILSVFRRAIPMGIFGALLALGTACSDGGTGEDDNTGDCLDNPDCASCQQDGECCEFSINCQPGSICNLSSDDLYDPNKDENICIKVVCNTDSDCDDGKICSLEKLCQPPICQTSAECPGAQLCLNGGCADAPNVGDVAACAVVSKATSIRQDQRFQLVAVARNQFGAALPGIPFAWTSANDNVVGVEGSEAIGGTEGGTASVTASVEGGVACDGSAEITNFPNLGGGEARVVIVADDTGLPVADAQVVVNAGGTFTSTTGPDGSATVMVAQAIESVTVLKTGWQAVTVFQPGTADVFLPLPRNPTDDMAGGFRGNIDLSATRKADIQLGIVGPAIPSNLLDFSFDSLIGDSIPTVINAPELGLDEEMVDLPGGILFGLGNKKFTDDMGGDRCQGDSPGENEIGCFLTRAPGGQTAGWALAGQLKLSQVTSIANELSNALGGGGEDLPIGDILTAILPLVRSLNHALNPSIEIQEFPTENGVADYSQYQKADMAASQSLGVLSTITVPDLPMNASGEGCATGALLITGVSLEGRGLVPLGLSAGLDILDMTDTPDCKIDGVEKPFGEQSADLDDGQMPLSMAPPHSGAEGNQILMLLVALDIDSIANSGLQATAVVKRVDSVGATESLSGTYLQYASGTVDRAGASLSLDSAVAGAKMIRLELQQGGQTWLVYAPGDTQNLTLPNVAGLTDIANNASDAFLVGVGMAANYDALWTFGSGATLDKLVDNVDTFLLQECSADATCQLQ